VTSYGAKPTSRSRRNRLGAATGMVLLGLMAACGSTTESEPTSTASATSTPQALATVPAELIAGLDVKVEEDQGPGRVTYAAVPVVPGAVDFSSEIQDTIDADVARFEQDTTPSESTPYPELRVQWEFVGASPDAIGVRLATSEFAASGDDGRVTIDWYDAANQERRTSGALLAPDAYSDAVTRLEQAAGQRQGVDPARVIAEAGTSPESLDAVAFATDGSLWVEFDEGTIAPPSLGPIGLVIDADGLLTPFGVVAQAAALSPSDPALSPAATSAATPPPTSSPASATPRPRQTTSTATSPSINSARPSAKAITGTVNCQKVKCAALTFDDGPVAGTNDLLDVLKERGARATFFVVGRNAKANPQILRRMKAEGHVIGNHTFDHAQLTRLGAAEVRSEISKVNDAVQKATGTRPTLLRPPYGATNSTVATVSRDLGMAQVLWNVDPLDWKDRDSATVTKRVLANTRNGSIVLSHDIHSTTRAAYARIIDDLQRRGFTLVTVPELIGDPTPGKKYFSASS
jgi:peptidoglycan/xylan/chitin deacetylase (PgdA/CDA1 family)